MTSTPIPTLKMGERKYSCVPLTIRQTLEARIFHVLQQKCTNSNINVLESSYICGHHNFVCVSRALNDSNTFVSEFVHLHPFVYAALLFGSYQVIVTFHDQWWPPKENDKFR